jgi:hypothetical protein
MVQLYAITSRRNYETEHLDKNFWRITGSRLGTELFNSIRNKFVMAELSIEVSSFVKRARAEPRKSGPQN